MSVKMSFLFSHVSNFVYRYAVRSLPAISLRRRSRTFDDYRFVWMQICIAYLSLLFIAVHKILNSAFS